jgi:SAM-dependent methyltransferase
VSSHWKQIHRYWSRIPAPLRPNAEVAAAFKDGVAGRNARVLLLGVTPELADLGHDTIAVDVNPNMIEHIWPGDTAHRRAIEGNWLHLPLGDESRTAVIGDGCLTVMEYPAPYQALFAELRRVLEPDGRAILRTFCAPSGPEALETVRAECMDGNVGSIHSLKFRVAMAMVCEQDQPNLPVRTLWEKLNDLFPDRHDLARATGWPEEDIATIDTYRESDVVYSFPTTELIAETARHYFDAVSFLPSGTYEIADRCPLVVLDKA